MDEQEMAREVGAEDEVKIPEARDLGTIFTKNPADVDFDFAPKVRTVETVPKVSSVPASAPSSISETPTELNSKQPSEKSVSAEKETTKEKESA